MGDGANDLPMIHGRDRELAFMAKPIVWAGPYQIQERNLYRVIDLLIEKNREKYAILICQVLFMS